MAKIIVFPNAGHARAPSTGRAAARVSNVIFSEQPLSTASRTKSGQRRAGMPRLRQELTVEAGSPSLEQSTAVPPNTSITASAVSMAHTIIRDLRTCQGFADRETTGLPENAEIAVMAATKKKPSLKAPKAPKAPKANEHPYAEDGRRLKATREALGYSQEDFATAIGIKNNVYNPYETGKREISKKAAKAIRKRFGLSLDWIFCADATRLDNELYAKLIQYAA